MLICSRSGINLLIDAFIHMLVALFMENATVLTVPLKYTKRERPKVHVPPNQCCFQSLTEEIYKYILHHATQVSVCRQVYI